MTTIGQSISRIKNTVKGVGQDAFLTDRFVYSLIVKYAKTFIKRQDLLNVRLKFYSLFRRLNMVPLVEVDKIEACCGGVTTKMKIMRTQDKIPVPFEGAYGPFIRTVSSIDGSVEVYRTSPAQYTSMTKTSGFKFNKSKYYWYMGGYLYFPNIDWEYISLEGIFEDDISVFGCDKDSECKIKQDTDFVIPDDLFSEIEKQVLQDLGFTLNVPSDIAPSDKQNLLR